MMYDINDDDERLIDDQIVMMRDTCRMFVQMAGSEKVSEILKECILGTAIDRMSGKNAQPLRQVYCAILATGILSVLEKEPS